MKGKKYYILGTKGKANNTTLSELNEKQKILHCRTKLEPKNTTLSEQNEKQKYYIVGKQKQNWKQKNTTLSEQNEKKIPFCLNIKKRKKTTLSEKN